MITLLTDFGTVDGFVGAMKGVIASIAPDEPVVDITHDVSPQDVQAGAFALRNASSFYPPGTVHCAVVDPGVGTARRALALQTAHYRFVGPDNGLMTWAAEADGGVLKAFSCTNPDFHLPDVSCTFHGRDVFAPVAAHLAIDVPLAELGEPVDPTDLVRLPWRETPLPEEGEVEAWVVHVDRFGNVITSVPATDVQGRTLIDGKDVKVCQAYDRPPGTLVVVPGSAGLLELSVVGGSAAELLDLHTGARVQIGRGGST